MDNICRVFEERHGMGRRFSILVVSEGVKRPDGEYVTRRKVEESTDPLRLGGVGAWLAGTLEDMTGIESRTVVLGHLQRGGTPTARDRVLATLFGREAMAAAARGESDVMVALRREDVITVELEQVANQQRLVDPECALVRTARSVGTSFGDR
jgi:6-phosphofructokinase 1